eukprot:Gb_27260 [translate_table: standard]
MHRAVSTPKTASTLMKCFASYLVCNLLPVISVHSSSVGRVSSLEPALDFLVGFTQTDINRVLTPFFSYWRQVRGQTILLSESFHVRSNATVGANLSDGSHCRRLSVESIIDIEAGIREKNGASSLMGCCIKIKKMADAMDCTADGGYSHSKPCIQCGDLQNWRLLRLVTPDRPVDDVSTIGMFLTSVKANTMVGYLGVSAKDESRDPDYIPLACLGTRQRFRCGGVLDKM